MVSLEEKLRQRGNPRTVFYRQGGERIPLLFAEGNVPQYYLLVEHHNNGYHGHVLKLDGDQYVRTDQMITRVGEQYFIERHGKKRAKITVQQDKELSDIVRDVLPDVLAKLSRYPDENMRNPLSSYAKKIYP